MGRLFRIEVGYLRVECGGGEKILSEGEGSKCPLSLEYPLGTEVESTAFY